jgi:hypothetical protein
MNSTLYNTPNPTSSIKLPEGDISSYPGHQTNLYLPMTILINGKFSIDVHKESNPTPRSDLSLCVVESHLFCISALNLHPNDYKKKIHFKYSKSYYYYEPNHGSSALEKEIFEHNTLQILNHIQYLLALPLEEIPLHLEEQGDMKDLIMWRLDLPRETPPAIYFNY